MTFSDLIGLPKTKIAESREGGVWVRETKDDIT